MSLRNEYRITAAERVGIIQHYVDQFREQADGIGPEVELALDELWNRGPDDDVDAEVVVSVTINSGHILNVLEEMRKL